MSSSSAMLRRASYALSWVQGTADAAAAPAAYTGKTLRVAELVVGSAAVNSIYAMYRSATWPMTPTSRCAEGAKGMNSLPAYRLSLSGVKQSDAPPNAPSNVPSNASANAPSDASSNASSNPTTSR